jgi:hypothetical protein
MPRLDARYLKTTSKFWNTINDPSPGAVVSTANVSGSIIQPYSGQVGAILEATPQEALDHSDTSIGTLYGGRYMYVQLLSTSTNAAVRGQYAFWSDVDKGIVTADVTAGRQAGVFINVISKGNYGLIQVSGKASVLFVADTTADLGPGAIVQVDPAGTSKTDIPAAATALTFGTAASALNSVTGRLISTGAAAALDGAIGQIDLMDLSQLITGQGGF